MIERGCRYRAADRALNGREGEAPVAPLHPALARHDDGDPPGVVLHVGRSRQLLANREVARKHKNVLQIGFAKGRHGPSQQVRGHQHESGEAVGLDLPALPLIAVLRCDAEQVRTLAQEPAGLIRDVVGHQEVVEFVRNGEVATRFAPVLGEDGAFGALRVGNEAALELVGVEVLDPEDSESRA